MLNPYTSFLGALNPIDVIKQTPQQLAALVAPLSPVQLQRTPSLGTWSIRDIICHLADTELVFAFRLRQTLAEDHPILQPYDQDRWASRYSRYDTSSALNFFTIARTWNCTLISAVSPEDFTRPVTHPERGTMTFCTIVETMAGHDRNHLVRLDHLSHEEPTIHLFSYGTLQQANVQQSTFGRVLTGVADAMIGYTQTQIKITDPDVVGTSGLTWHPIVLKSTNPLDEVSGTVFTITAVDLAAADAYEVSDYHRIAVRLKSGIEAWVYVKE